MKRIPLIIICLILLDSANAQKTFQPESHLGIIQGVNFSRTDFEIFDIEQKFLAGYRGGIVFNYFSESFAGIQIELSYSEQGWKGTLDSVRFYDGRLNYIELPFLTSITLGKSRLFFVLNIGPYFSYEIMSDISEDTGYPSETDYKFGFGYCGGVGLGIHSSAGTFIIEGRYSNSLTNIYDPSENTDFRASRTQNINISLTYLIKLL